MSDRRNGQPSIAVFVPTYRRPDDLAHCLKALATQIRPPDQTIVVVREGDDATFEACRSRRHRIDVEIVTVARPGQVAALNAGLEEVRCDVVAFTDDDCRPHPQWTARICGLFAQDELLGAVGGRDIVHDRGAPVVLTATTVGQIRWFGRLVGNHHALSVRQDVQFLKGANMAYRTDALRGFDERLRGLVQMHNDLKASLDVWSRGWRLVWDPAVAVDHHPAPRADEDRLRQPLASMRREHHNEVCALVSVRPARFAVASVAYAFAMGTTKAPGPLLLPRAARRVGIRDALARCAAVTLGRREGVVTALRASGRAQAGAAGTGRRPQSSSS